MVRAVTKAHKEHGDMACASVVQGEVGVCQHRHASSPSSWLVVGPNEPLREKSAISISKEDRIECSDLAAKEEASQKKKERKNAKHTSGVAVYHFLPNPPKVMSRRAPEVTIRKGGW
jgi:hypothetical protein